MFSQKNASAYGHSASWAFWAMIWVIRLSHKFEGASYSAVLEGAMLPDMVLQGGSYGASGRQLQCGASGRQLQSGTSGCQAPDYGERKRQRQRQRERERERSLCEQVMWNGSIYIGAPCALMYIGAHCSLHTAQLVQVLDSRASHCSQWLPGSELTVQKRRPAKSRLKAQSRKLAQNVIA